VSASLAGRLRARGVDPTLLFRAFDPKTVEGRAKERQRRIALAALASGLAKLISIATALISVPLTLNYLGVERYGMWMTMSSLIAMLGFADLGVGNGLLTSIASAKGRDDMQAIKADVSSALAALMLAALAVLTAFGILYSLVDWRVLFNVATPGAAREAGPALAALIVCFALAMPTGVVQRTQMGLQLGFIASLWQCLSSLTALIGVLAAIRWRLSLPWLVLAYAGSPLLIGWLNAIVFFNRLAPEIAPGWRWVSPRAMRAVAGAGLMFLALQIVGSLAYASDNIILAQMLGPSAVAEYAVPAQMFGPVNGVLLMVLLPLWPAYGEAIARGDDRWVKRTLARSLVVSLTLASALSATLAIAGPRLVELWVGRAVAPPLALLCALAVWKVVEAAGNALAVFLNGARILGFQVATGASFVVLALTLKIGLIKVIGLPGVPIATATSYLVCVLLPLYLLRKRVFRVARPHPQTAPLRIETLPR